MAALTTARARAALRQQGASVEALEREGAGPSLEQLEHLRQTALDVAAPAVLRPDRVGDCGERPVGSRRMSGSAKAAPRCTSRGRPRIGDAPRVVERGLEDYAAPEELARREAAPGVLDVARHLGVDPEEDIHVRCGRVRRLGSPGPAVEPTRIAPPTQGPRAPPPATTPRRCAALHPS